MGTTIYDYFQTALDLNSLESSKVVNFSKQNTLREELKQNFDTFFTDCANSDEHKREDISKLLESFKKSPELLKGNILNLKKIYDAQIIMPAQILRDLESIKSEAVRNGYFNNGIHITEQLIAQFKIIRDARFLLINHKIKEVLFKEESLLYEKLCKDFQSLIQKVIQTADESRSFQHQFSLDMFTASFCGDKRLIRGNLYRIIEVFMISLTSIRAVDLHSGSRIVTAMIDEVFESEVKKRIGDQNFKNKIDVLVNKLYSDEKNLQDVDKFFLDEWVEKIKKA